MTPPHDRLRYASLSCLVTVSRACFLFQVSDRESVSGGGGDEGRWRWSVALVGGVGHCQDAKSMFVMFCLNCARASTFTEVGSAGDTRAAGGGGGVVVEGSKHKLR